MIIAFKSSFNILDMIFIRLLQQIQKAGAVVHSCTPSYARSRGRSVNPRQACAALELHSGLA